MTENNGSPPERSDTRRKPKQVRSVETRNSILEAACELFQEQGYEKTTTHQIAGRADVSVGALYRYFADKEAILKEVYRRENSVLRDRILEEFSSISIVSQDVRSLIREALGRAFKIYAEHPRLRQVLGEQSRKVPELIELRQTQENELYQTVGNILSSVPEVELPDVEVGAYMVVLFCENIIEDFLLRRQDHPTFTRERTLDAAADLLLRYLIRKG